MTAFFPTRVLLAMQAALFIAYHGREGCLVKSSQIVARYKLNRRALEPVLQVLARAQIVDGRQGVNGGYYIAAPEKVSLGAITRLFMDEAGKDDLLFTDLRSFILPALTEAQEALLQSLDQITLSDLCANMEEKGGIEPLLSQPLDFII